MLHIYKRYSLKMLSLEVEFKSNWNEDFLLRVYLIRFYLDFAIECWLINVSRKRKITCLIIYLLYHLDSLFKQSPCNLSVWSTKILNLLKCSRFYIFSSMKKIISLISLRLSGDWWQHIKFQIMRAVDFKKSIYTIYR